jgi:hypothetical protein
MEYGPVPTELTRRAVADAVEKVYQASRIEYLREHDITIEFLSMGCVIKVGCKKIAFTNIDEAMKELTEYVKDPYTAREKWFKIFDAQ